MNLFEAGPRGGALVRLRDAVWRHGLTAFGPISVSGANFVATLAALHALDSREFGQLSFVIVLVAFCVSLTNGLLGAPLAAIAHVPRERLRSELDTYFKSGLVFAGLLGLAVAVATRLTGVALSASALFGVYGAAMSLRLVGRTYSYTQTRIWTVILSDSAYSVSLLLGMGLLLAPGRTDLSGVALVFAISPLASIVFFGAEFSRDLVRALGAGSIRAYGRVWHDFTRWSFLGVVTSEMTMNAHAYLVTFLSGSRVFALIAAGTLFTRPFALVLTALPDREGPALARLLAAGERLKALRSLKEFGVVVAALWLANQVLTLAVLLLVPGLVMKKGYDPQALLAVIGIWALITAVRGARAPDCLLLQALREFRALANASVASSVVALAATLTLLLAWGPVPSLFGILAGDIALWLVARAAVRSWKREGALRPAFEAPARAVAAG